MSKNLLMLPPKIIKPLMRALAIAKRRNALKILIFLNKNDDASYLQEIANALDMNEMTAFGNLSKLIDAGIIKKRHGIRWTQGQNTTKW